MTFFKSKFGKLETLVAAKSDDRTPEMLSAAQEEMDRNNADLILVPKTEKIKTGADLQNHIEGLEKAVTDAKAATTVAEAATKKAEEALTTLKGKRVIDTARETADADTGGDNMGQENEAQATAKVVNSPNSRWNAMADEMGMTVEATTTPAPETKTA